MQNNQGGQQESLPVINLSRRGFLATGSAAMGLVAGPFSQQSFAAEQGAPHEVPADKQLAPDWLQSLSTRGKPRVYQGETNQRVGMPVGGVAAGQLYVTGDGTLDCWWIHNRWNKTGRRDNYQRPLSGRKLRQGYAVRVRREGAKQQVRTLDRRGYPEVQFIGQYPINRVLYREEGLGLAIDMEAFSPFVPLSSNDSMLPATLMEFTLQNETNAAMEVDLLGYLQNPVGVLSRDAQVEGQLTQRVVRQGDTTALEFAGRPPIARPDEATPRPAIELANFEGDDYGDWQASGDALGDAPADGAIGRQNPVSGFEGEQLVNTYRPNDRTRGTLRSPEFTIQRKYINFLVGGGNARRDTYLRLLVEGKEVERTGGRDAETLAWSTWDVAAHEGKPARIEIVDNATGAWGHINVDTIEQADEHRNGVGDFVDQSDFGTACLALLDGDDVRATADAATPLDVKRLLSDGDGPTEVAYPLAETCTGALGTTVSLAAGERKTLRFLLAWHFPIRRGPFLRNGQHNKEVLGTENIGNYYATLFSSASDVVRYVDENYDRLAGDTRLYHRTFYEDSTLPWWFLERVGQTPSILATETVHVRSNGRLWGWEGVGCCGGTCTHVWNYEQALARLFPDLERSVREMQDFGVGLGPTGIISFRGDSYTVEARYAADGQAGTIMRAYREHLMSPDDSFLKRIWPAVKKATEFCLERDANNDGLIEDRQHNTYDNDFYGPNTLIGSLYLGALRAAAEMASIVGDGAFAEKCRQVFEAGKRKSGERLFNGEYFMHDVMPGEGRQYGQGCLSDQMMGQSLAHQVGLGYLYEPEQVRSALSAVYKYNWTPDVGAYNKLHAPWRWYARQGEAGLFVCTWPKSPRPGKTELSYRNEVWNGVEYHTAAGMIYEGQVEQGMAIVRGIHDRYNGIRQNPFNEVECGEHYARSMAAWGCLLAVCGYHYDGPQGVLRFAPRMQQDKFRAFFTAAEGWGSLNQREADGVRTCRVELAWGKLHLTQLELDGANVTDSAKTKVAVNNEPIAANSVKLVNGRLVLELPETTIEAGQAIEVTCVVG
ncbi:GH116 family glycosyl hydrolase [Aeoliella sp.]|uniref:GH116 family glycosyl hydrolase n=1 Tax=Aeoliella sp. TaxID=2795800 RepID=UPI003CCBF67E